MNLKKLIAFFIAAFFAVNVFSQEALKSVEEEYYDFLSLTGITERPTLGYRTLSDSVWNYNENVSDEITDEIVTHPWSNLNLGKTFTLWQYKKEDSNWFTKGIPESLKLKIYGPKWFNSYNTKTPYGQNDGALWQGSGYNTSLTAGLRLEGYGFEFTVKPQLSWMENKEFEFIEGVNGSKYSYFCGGIDLVQRYGDSSLWNFNWGDSEVRWSWHSFTVGFGTQNPWLGPAWLNPMLGSNNAPGYPKVDIGLRKTKIIIPGIDLYLGEFEGRVWTGKLTQSDYVNTTYNYDTMVNGLTIAYSIPYFENFVFGGTRIILSRFKNENFKYIGRLFTMSKGNDVSGEGEDQKVALFFDWILPKAGFEVFLEFGVDDYTTYPLENFFHTAIYTVGIKQRIPIELHKIIKTLPVIPLDSEFIFEFNNFEMSQDFQMQWQYGGYYVHGQIMSGYTNGGQILGAGTGSFGNSQFFGYKIFYPRGSVLLSMQRFCPNNNYIYNKAVNADASKPSAIWEQYWANFEANLTFGLYADYYILDSLRVGGSATFIKHGNYMYKRGNDFNSFSFTLEAEYTL